MLPEPVMYTKTVRNDVRGVDSLHRAESVVSRHRFWTSGPPHQRSPSPPVVFSVVRLCQTAGDESQEHGQNCNSQADSIGDGNVNLTTLINMGFLVCDLRESWFSHNSLNGQYNAAAGEG